jgi:hypothetical protein
MIKMTKNQQKKNNYFISFSVGVLFGLLLFFSFKGIDVDALYVLTKQNENIQFKIDSITILKENAEQDYNNIISTIDSLSKTELCTEFERVFGFNPYDVFGSDTQ